ncbi:hypothetical protein TNCV_2133011 [Trichonephila clavipes]|nr:hypothetical protein TNCV_2133011 [Trichonephila clavipes]
MFVIGSQNFRQKMLVIVGKLIRTKDAELADPAEAKAQTQLKGISNRYTVHNCVKLVMCRMSKEFAELLRNLRNKTILQQVNERIT